MESLATTAAALLGGSRNHNSGTISSDLLNGVVGNLWPHINAAVCKTVKETVEPSFRDLPGPLRTLQFAHIDLGNVPFAIDSVVVHDTERNDTAEDNDNSNNKLQFDLDIIWDGNCDIQLQADYLGRFGVSQLKFHGRLSVLLSPLLSVLPVVGAAQVCFLNPPTFDIDFVGLANVADLGVIKHQIRSVITSIIGDMLVLPNRMHFKVDPACSFLDAHQPPAGVARVTVQSGSGFCGKRGLLSDAHDVFVELSLGASKPCTTAVIENASDPVWENATYDFVCWDYDQTVTVHAWDRDALDRDDDLGSAQVSVRDLLYSTNQTCNLELHGGSHRGGRIQIRCQLCSLSMADLSSLEHQEEEADETQESGKNLLQGLVTILVVGVHDLPLAKKDARTSVKVVCGDGQQTFQTATVADAAGVDCLNPVFDSAFTVPIDQANNKSTLFPIEFILLNDNGSADDDKKKKEPTVLGTTTVTYDDLVRDRVITDVRGMIGDGGDGDEAAKLEFRVSLCGVVPPPARRPVALLSGRGSSSNAQATSSSVTASTALCTVRLTVLRGWGFQVEKRRHRLLKKRREDIPDVYCNITFGSSPTVWRTSTVRDSVTPEWNASRDYLLSDRGQVISLHVLDQDRGKRDRDDALGSARIAAGKLLLLAGGTMDLELRQEGRPTGQYISIRCDVVEEEE